MSQCIERCARCVVPQMVARTNGVGGCYLECPRCGHVDAVTRKPDPCPTRVYIDPNGKKRRRYNRIRENKLPSRPGRAA